MSCPSPTCEGVRLVSPSLSNSSSLADCWMHFSLTQFWEASISRALRTYSSTPKHPHEIPTNEGRQPYLQAPPLIPPPQGEGEGAGDKAMKGERGRGERGRGLRNEVMRGERGRGLGNEVMRGKRGRGLGNEVMRGEREGGAWGTRGLTLFRTDSLLSLPEGIDWTRICIPDFTLPMVVPREVLCVHMFIHVCVCYT